MRTHFRTYVLLLVFGAISVVSVVRGFDQHQYPYNPDSSFYVEAGRSVRTSHSLAVTAALQNIQQETETLSLWPPGFPLMIAAVSSGIPVQDAALLVARVSWAVLPCAVFFALLPLLGATRSIGVAILATLAPGVLQEGRIVSTDVPFLVLGIASIGILIRAARNDGRAWLPWAGAGVLAGLAYTVRNVGIALLAASAATFAAAWVLKLWDWRIALRRGAAWSAGAAVFTLPLLIFNWATWGSLQPYEMPPSTIGLVDNARTFLSSQLMDLFASQTLADVAWNGIWLAILAVPAAGVAAFLSVRFWNSADDSTRFAALLLSLYVAAGTCVVVLARTKYQWGEIINLRHATQYSWALGALALMLIPSSKTRSRYLIATAGTIAAVLLAARGAYAWDEYRSATEATKAIADVGDVARAMELRGAQIGTRAIRHWLARDSSLLEQVRNMEPTAYIASNRADVFSIETGRTVRHIETTDNLTQLSSILTSIRSNLPCARAMYIVITADTTLVRDHGLDWRTAVEAKLGSQFPTAQQSSNWLLLRSADRQCAAS